MIKKNYRRVIIVIGYLRISICLVANVGGYICILPITYDSISAHDEFEFPSRSIDGVPLLFTIILE